MANSKNDFTDVITDKRTIPYNVTKQGTISTIGKNVKGSYAMAYNTLVGTFKIGEIVTGTTSGATATINQDSGTSLNLLNISGIFQNAEVLTGATSGATAAVNGAPTYTLFTQQCRVGDFLVSLTQNEVHKISFITDDGSMQIQEAFGSDLTSVPIVISPSVPRPKEISVLIPTGNPNGLIDGVTLTAGVAWNASKTAQYNNGIVDGFIDPITVDATGTSMIIQIVY